MHISENKPVEYLTIGHLTKDLAENGYTLGGTAAYASLTANSFNLPTALVTSCAADLDLAALAGVQVKKKLSSTSTTFENIETDDGRVQILHETADVLTCADIQEPYRNVKIAHIGPVANEVDTHMVEWFSEETLIGITPQGWMRQRAEDGRVGYKEWLPSSTITQRADAVVISDEDVRKDESIIQNYAHLFGLLAVTEGFNGARVYWRGDVRHFSAPRLQVLDATGAGDIFAAAFFIRLKATNDPWQAAEVAVSLASLSITRKGLSGIPGLEEVQSNLMEIIKGSSSQ